MRRITLTFVMLLEGAVLIAGAALSIVPTAFFPIDEVMGTQASAAALALGIGICVAAANPAANVGWVRIGILYPVLVIGYQVFTYTYLGKSVAMGAVLVAIAFGTLLAALYPQRKDLIPKTPRQAHATRIAPGTGPELTPALLRTDIEG